METEKVIFSGHVQGVGFRYSCKIFADQIGITGTVHNDINGDVIAIIQGSQDLLDEWIRKLPTKISPWARIAKFERTKISYNTVYHDFQII